VSARLRRKPRLVQDINTFLRFKSLPLFCNKDRFCIIARGAALAGDYAAVSVSVAAALAQAVGV
jgi:hypothetical protein